MDENDILKHYGMPKRSGRYPWGSGKEPYQHSGDFLSRLEELSKSGMSEREIAEYIGLTTTQLRVQKSLANSERRALDVATARGLREKGYSLSEITEKMGFNNDSSVRNLLNENSEMRMNQAQATADIIRKQIDEKGMIDVGAGVERELGVSKEKLTQALYILELEGYPIYKGGVPQATNSGQQTNLKVICPPGTEHKEIYNFDKINTITDYVSRDNGHTFQKFEYPTAMDGKRLQIVYDEQGGTKKDGVIEIRRGVKDLDLGNSNYAQIRLMVDGKTIGTDTNRYLKGMAVYSDDLPKGVDVRFNTNKKQGTPVGDVLKPVKNDPNNPFGSLIKANGQSYYDDPNGKFTDPVTGKKKSLSLINKRAEEGDWTEWSDTLPSQFLSKQNLSLIKQQLKLTVDSKKADYDEIRSLTNPVIKKALLKNFSDDCDSAAVHLKAASLPRQEYNVILPINSLKDTEVYAPHFANGEKVALVRFPHGGTFEIPILTVNNKNADAKKIIGPNAKDAVGITSKVAERLSGADFDGDTVLTIPISDKVKITSTSPLKGLEGFDSKMYKYSTMKKDSNGVEHYYDANGVEFKKMKNTQTEMGKISNLITDMTLKGANTDELSKAVRHSMVVIDAEKHKLNYKQSEVDNDIASLKNRYQGTTDADGRYHTGASTLLSRAKSEVQVIKRKGSPQIDKETGEQTWKEDYQEYTDSKGKVKVRTQKSTKMFETKDAHTLSSGTKPEEAYANYANQMKALANEARKEMVNTPNLQYSSGAKELYKNQVKSLDAQLNIALKNAPKERKAQTMANSIVKSKKQDNPDLTKAEIKKISQQALTEARLTVGAKRETIKISDDEWEAIQAGAISDNKLQQIIRYADMDVLRQKATPRSATTLSTAKQNKINSMMASGYTTSEIAKAIGVSASTVQSYMKGDV